jgi:hypothetical protein
MKTLTITIALAALMWACGDERPAPPTGTVTVTPRGARVTVLSGPQLDAEGMLVIDEQIQRVADVAKEVNPKYVFPRHVDYRIELVAPDASCGGGFRVAAGQYGDGTICVAGQFGDRRFCSAASCPPDMTIRTTLEAVKRMHAIHYEGEHFGLRLNDEAEYLRTLTHVPPAPPHPILGKE